jgi:hypothetical protein
MTSPGGHFVRPADPDVVRGIPGDDGGAPPADGDAPPSAAAAGGWAAWDAVVAAALPSLCAGASIPSCGRALHVTGHGGEAPRLLRPWHGAEKVISRRVSTFY